jgi:hypothetical protein
MEKEIFNLNNKINEEEESKTIELNENTSLIINIEQINTEGGFIVQQYIENTNNNFNTSQTISEEDIQVPSNGYYFESHPSDTSRINIDNMTYEQLLELQDRIGFVNKGFSLPELEVNINLYPSFCLAIYLSTIH